MFDAFETIVLIQQWFLSFWWLWLFIALSILAKSLWKAYIQEYYKRSVTWALFELRIPREVRKSPRAMEQVFVTIHAIRNSPSNIKEAWWEGEVPLWFSFEAASFGGEIHFYMRVPEKHANMVEASMYGNYPDIEIVRQSEDYIDRFPSSYQEFAKTYKLFGNELILSKPDAYPIRTYIDFEDNEEERQLDPISSLMEVLAKIKSQETIWVQLIARPLVDDTETAWKKECKDLITDLKEKAKTEFVTETGKVTFTERSPGDVEIMKAIERCIAKPGFQSILRYLYFSPPDIHDSNFGQRGVLSAVNQYMSESLNRFKHNTKVWTKVSMWFWPFIFPTRRGEARRARIYKNYRKRKIPDEGITSKILEMQAFNWGIKGQSTKMILNTEELATIFHLPTAIVLTGPLIKRVEAKKTGPPAGLPIYGEEGESGNLPGASK